MNNKDSAAAASEGVPELLDEVEAALQARFPYLANYDAAAVRVTICQECNGAIDDHKATCIVPQLYWLSKELRQRIESVSPSVDEAARQIIRDFMNTISEGEGDYSCNECELNTYLCPHLFKRLQRMIATALKTE